MKGIALSIGLLGTLVGLYIDSTFKINDPVFYYLLGFMFGGLCAITM